ncbi:DUF5060 domain-containing protein [Mucilaginibacter terrenus]|uniref:DUF5060 domain-containing protein n=1 Tax=Mucilaginibacter terrenus TaxID=2482727 RepID=A0A3E2NY65_9SPHI|nr:DUF5060 domain-containing protein [Mucilaginibacter terrenus]RFZ85879.1 DUF5060 domain-containing protein [Mucilaginibacter terrenus]
MKPLRIILLLLVISFTRTFCEAQPGLLNFTYNDQPFKQYEKFEWTINLSAAFTNPYDQHDIKVDMEIISPSGKQLGLPCYYESGDSKASVWKGRFAPQQTGEYRYTFVVKSKSGEWRSDMNFITATATAKQGFLHKNNLWTFKYDNGELFRGVGENIGWESRSFENDKYTYDYLLPKLAKSGGNFFRTWMCYWNMPLQWKKVQSTKRYHKSGDYFNPGAIKRMDELLNLTDSLNLKFMLTLDWHGHLMEEGGWKNSNYNAANGGPAKTPAEFFTSQEARAMYKNKLRYIVARWGYSTSIAAWEFFNEVDNAAFTGADSVLIPLHTITEWHDEMSRYLKDIDPYGHLVTTSVSHRDITAMNAIPYIDFNQKHIYKHTDKIAAIYPDYISAFGKPYVIGEFGFRWEDDDQKYGNDADYDFKRGLWYGMFSPTPILPMSWWWEMFDQRNMTPYFKGVRMISDEMLKAGNGSFEQVTATSGNIETYVVKCGKSYFVYMLNNTYGTLPPKIVFPVNGRSFTMQYFDPATQTYSNHGIVPAEGGKLTLNNVHPGLKKERVLILTAK